MHHNTSCGKHILSPCPECFLLIVDLLVIQSLIVSASYINIKELFFRVTLIYDCLNIKGSEEDFQLLQIENAKDISRHHLS